MADLHIDDFCHDVLWTLMRLYNAFPRRQSIFVEDISGPDAPDEVGLHSRRHMACLGAMLWLAEEGYIRYEATIYQDGIDQAVLTQPTFVLLTAPSELRFEEPGEQLPDTVVRGQLTLAQQIRAALRSKSSDRITAIGRYFLSRSPRAVDPEEFNNLLDDDGEDSEEPGGSWEDYFL